MEFCSVCANAIKPYMVNVDKAYENLLNQIDIFNLNIPGLKNNDIEKVIELPNDHKLKLTWVDISDKVIIREYDFLVFAPKVGKKGRISVNNLDPLHSMVLDIDSDQVIYVDEPVFLPMWLGNKILDVIDKVKKSADDKK